MAQQEHQTPGRGDWSPDRRLRSPELPFQLFGYSREHTDRLLAQAADESQDTISRLEARVTELQAALAAAEQRNLEVTRVEREVGEIMVTAHRAVETLRNEAQRQADELLGGAHSQANTIVEEAERQARDAEANRALAEEALAAAHDEAKTIHDVIDAFRYQWWNLMTEALKQLESRVPQPDGGAAETDPTLPDELRERLGEARVAGDTVADARPDVEP